MKVHSEQEHSNTVFLDVQMRGAKTASMLRIIVQNSDILCRGLEVYSG